MVSYSRGPNGKPARPRVCGVKSLFFGDSKHQEKNESRLTRGGEQKKSARTYVCTYVQKGLQYNQRQPAPNDSKPLPTLP